MSYTPKVGDKVEILDINDHSPCHDIGDILTIRYVAKAFHRGEGYYLVDDIEPRCDGVGGAGTYARVRPVCEVVQEVSDSTTADEIVAICDRIKAMLLAKNEAYGDSALDPVRVFAPEASADLQLRVRIDDKLSRIKRGVAMGEDMIDDTIGYLILLKISRARGEK